MVGNLVAMLSVSKLPFSPVPLIGGPAMRTSSDGSALFWLAAIGGVVVVGVVVLSIVTRVLHHRSRSSQAGLFDGLCKLHELSRNHRTLLKQLAASYGLGAMPARVFTEPRWLEPNPNNPLFRTRAAELAAIRDRLFGTGDDPQTGGGA